MYDGDKDKEKGGGTGGTAGGAGAGSSDNCDIEENTGFAIVVNGHSLVHCLSSELEHR